MSPPGPPPAGRRLELHPRSPPDGPTPRVPRPAPEHRGLGKAKRRATDKSTPGGTRKPGSRKAAGTRTPAQPGSPRAQDGQPDRQAQDNRQDRSRGLSASPSGRGGSAPPAALVSVLRWSATGVFPSLGQPHTRYPCFDQSLSDIHRLHFCVAVGVFLFIRLHAHPFQHRRADRNQRR